MTDEKAVVFGVPKNYEELDFTDDFLFCKILTANLELCRELLEIIMDIKIRKVKLAESQKSIKITRDSKSVRLDVYVEDESIKVFINPYGKDIHISKELQDLLDYLQGKESESSFVERIKEEVEKAKCQKEWKVEYMTLLMREQEIMERGIEKGIEIGQKEKSNQIIVNMLKQQMPIEQIAQLCSVTIEEIVEIRHNMEIEE